MTPCHLVLGLAILLCPDGATPAHAPATTATAAQGDEAPVLTIDGQPVSRAAFKDFLYKRFGPSGIDFFLNNLLIEREAKAQGVEAPSEKDADAWIDSKIAQATAMDEFQGADPDRLRKEYKPLARQFMIEETLIKRARTGEEGLRREYDLRFGEKRKVRHILLRGGAKEEMMSPEQFESARKKADEVHDMLAKGADFAALANTLSADPGSAASGGDLGGEIDANSPLVPEFLEATLKLKEGELSAPVKTQFGYHLIQVTKVLPPAKPFDEKVKEELKADALKRDVGRAEEQHYIDDLRKKYKFEKKLE